MTDEPYKMRRTHYGRFLGVPVYLDLTTPECPGIEPRHVVLEPVLWAAERAFEVFCGVNSLMDPDFEPLFPILVGRPVEDDA